jgi:hypothetical protein
MSIYYHPPTLYSISGIFSNVKKILKANTKGENFMLDPKIKKRITKYKYQSWVVPGWFTLTDYEMFVAINTVQEKFAVSGNLLEIGTFCGKSGALLSLLAAPGESVSLLDLFDEVKFEENLETQDYRKMTMGRARKTLDKYGQAYKLVEGNSLEIEKLIPITPHRLIHIDGSHQYEVVKKDLLNALKYLTEGGVIVLDDYRNFQFPGVGRALWEFVESHKMFLICSTPTKAYITSSNPSHAYKDELKKLFESRVSVKVISGGENEFDLIYLRLHTSIIQKILSVASSIKLKFSPIQIV